MTVVIDLTEAQLFTALRSVLLGMLPGGTEVIRTEINRVAEPVGPDFVAMTPIHRTRLATDLIAYPVDVNAITFTAMQETEVTVQLDVHGPASAENVQIISTLMRTPYACDAFTALGYAVQPLYADDPHQTPFLNAEQQFEFRWTVDVVLQANPVVTVSQQFANTVTVGLINVDAAYPPTR